VKALVIPSNLEADWTAKDIPSKKENKREYD
jgi:hypothetical protein